MDAETIGLAILLTGVLLVAAKLVRLRVGIVQRLFLPSSIVAGVIALLLGPEVLGAVADRFGGGSRLTSGLWSEPILDVWTEMPELLISVVFATLFLGRVIPSPKSIWRLAGPQLAFGVTMATGQYVIGLLAAVLVLVPVFGLPPMVGALIEVGFEGGHGTAAGLAGTFEDLGFAEGADLALGLATVGVVSGVVAGIALINWGVRTGRTDLLEGAAEASKAKQRGVFEKEDRSSGGDLTTRPESIEPLSIHFAFVAIAVLIGAVMLAVLQALEDATWGAAGDFAIIEFVPLFPLAMLGGVVLQLVLRRFDRFDLVDERMIARIQGLALDLLIVTALATLSLEVIGANLGAFAILAFLGVGWNVAAFVFLARRMIPDHWFERGISDLGQSMGVTATGLLLLRIADPEGQTPAYESFGYKQLGFEPFLGGGLVTAAAVPLVAQLGPYPVLAVMSVAMAAALALGILYFGRRPLTPTERRTR